MRPDLARVNRTLKETPAMTTYPDFAVLPDLDPSEALVECVCGATAYAWVADVFGVIAAFDHDLICPHREHPGCVTVAPDGLGILLATVVPGRREHTNEANSEACLRSDDLIEGDLLLTDGVRGIDAWRVHHVHAAFSTADVTVTLEATSDRRRALMTYAPDTRHRVVVA